ncbi:glutaredoxin-C9-like [Cornus florida]|uniref:glutaredoxin-C9-like n=1 Tax=Cornus florida TaxID=4283 RepID=UPI00289B9CBA|nr:glutaredoxin-C9-like [Cornus florida]
MQEALPYKMWLPSPTPNSNGILQLMNYNDTKTGNSTEVIEGSNDHVKKMLSDNAVIVFGMRGCCMSHVVKRLLQGLGVNPAVYEVDEEDEASVVHKLEDTIGAGDSRLQFPAVYIGGRLFGGLDRIMATHITGELTPVLKEAGALWL